MRILKKAIGFCIMIPTMQNPSNGFLPRCKEIIIVGKQRIHVSIALGNAVYDPQIDKCFMDVFNRADDAMYENKRKIKKYVSGNA